MASDDRSASFLALIWALFAITVPLVSLRLYARAVLVRALGLDDLFCVLTFILNTGLTILWTVYAKNGGCKRFITLSHEQQILALMLIWVLTVLCIWVATLGEISVALFILRIIAKTYSWVRRLLYGIILVQSTMAIVSTILIFVQCRPLHLLWEPVPSMRRDSCWEPAIARIVTMVTSGLRTAVNVLLVVIPSRIVLNLRIPGKQKLILICVMGTGIFAAICAGIKTYKIGALQDTSDPTYSIIPLFMWTVAESNAILIAACVPTLKALLVNPKKRESLSPTQTSTLTWIGKHSPVRSSASSPAKEVVRVSTSDEKQEEVPEGMIRMTTHIQQEVEPENEKGSDKECV